MSNNNYLRGDGTLKYGDVHEKFNFSEMQELQCDYSNQGHLTKFSTNLTTRYLGG